MQILSSAAPTWSELEEVSSTSGQQLDGRLRQLLGAERLVVLTGLGTSRCITDPEGHSLAPTMEDLWNRARARTDEEAWTHALERAGWNDDFRDDIELLLSRCQMALALGTDTGLESLAACEQEIVSGCSFVESDTLLPVHEAFLRRVARRPTRLPRTQLFTTNYDLAFETAASRTGFALVDGFSHAAPQRFDSGYFDVDFAVRDRERAATPVDWMPSVLHLLKLHGSVDWDGDASGVTRSPSCDRPLIVYPRSSKFEISYQQPFLELMSRFQSSLRRADTGLLIIGSGLADRHVVEPILAAVRANVRLSVMVVSPGLADSDNDTVKALQSYIANGDRRLSLVAASFEDLVPRLPDVMPDTEAEQHRERVDGDA